MVILARVDTESTSLGETRDHLNKFLKIRYRSTDQMVSRVMNELVS